MAIILASGASFTLSHRSVVFLIRVARSDVGYLSREAPERCSTLPFVLKMAKNEIVAGVGGYQIGVVNESL